VLVTTSQCKVGDNVLSCFSANDKTNVRDSSLIVTKVIKQFPHLTKNDEKQKIMAATAGLKWKDALKNTETDSWTLRWLQENQNN